MGYIGLKKDEQFVKLSTKKSWLAYFMAKLANFIAKLANFKAENSHFNKNFLSEIVSVTMAEY
jgi:hypothetical protein